MFTNTSRNGVKGPSVRFMLSHLGSSSLQFSGGNQYFEWKNIKIPAIFDGFQDSLVIVANIEEDQQDNNPAKVMADDCNDPRPNNERKTLDDCSTIHRIATMDDTIGKRGDMAPYETRRSSVLCG